MNKAQTVLTRLSHSCGQSFSTVYAPKNSFSPLQHIVVFPQDVTMALSFNMLGNAHIFLITLITAGKHSKQLNFNVDKGRKGVVANQVSFTV